ncbi:hypothetical protein AB1Y20_023653 [Prymnesium parvum]|uniref:lipid-A-disaccharide synthase n=1 Tax=Prymnesium parvum TaxID=97485 RepID=A0AB34JGW4_PRYPA
MSGWVLRRVSSRQPSLRVYHAVRRLGAATDAQPLKVFLVAGESSGDAIGGRLMHALREEHRGPIMFEGVGGKHMQSAGLRSLFPMEDLSVMGFSELIPALPRLAYRWHQTLAAARAAQPQLVVGIDSKGFCLRLLGALAADRRVGKTVAAATPLLVQYVAPSVWAFHDAHARARRLAGVVDELLLLLPFEEPIFRAAGISATFVGHPSMEEEGVGWWKQGSVQGAAAASLLRQRCGIPEGPRVVTLLPGSRHAEVYSTLPVMLEALQLLADATDHSDPRARAITAVLPVATAVRATIGDVLRRMHFGEVDVHLVGEEDRAAAYHASSLALACCGTVNVELALSSTPQVVLWRSSWLTHFVIERWLRPKLAYASLPNILWHEARTGGVSGPSDCPPLLPECLLGNCSAESVAIAARHLIGCSDTAAKVDTAAQVVSTLALQASPEGPIPPSKKAAQTLLCAIRKRRSFALRN